MSKRKLASEQVCVASGRKVKFPSRKQALGARNHVRSRGGKTLRIYHCPHCHAWHFTSQSETNGAG